MLIGVYLRAKRTKKLNRNFNKEEDSSLVKNRKTQLKDDTGLAEIRDVLLEKNERFLQSNNKRTCTWSWQAFWSPVAFFFFFKEQRKKDGSSFEQDTVFSSQKTPTSHMLAKTYSVLSFDWINLFNLALLHFDLLSKPSVSAIVFSSQWKLSLSDACQMTAKSLDLHFLSGPLSRTRLINILFLSILNKIFIISRVVNLGFFCPYCKFFSLFLMACWPARFPRGP